MSNNPQTNSFNLLGSTTNSGVVNLSDHVSNFRNNFDFEINCLRAVPDLRCVQYLTQDVLIPWGELQLKFCANQYVNNCEKVQKLAKAIISSLFQMKDIGMFSNGDTLLNLIADTDLWIRVPLFECLAQHHLLAAIRHKTATTIIANEYTIGAK